MTPEQQRISISEACGWRQRAKAQRTNVGFKGYDNFFWNDPKGFAAKEPPNYTNDLNAMHEAEDVLDEGQRIAYKEMICDMSPKDPSVSLWGLCHAKSTTRAEAFLRTIGKWQEK